MSTIKIAPYGTWESPITTDIVSGSSLNFYAVYTHPETQAIYLNEGRPTESGRAVIVQVKENETIDVLPQEYNARSKIHEYGGAAAVVDPKGNIVFTDAKTLGVFRLSLLGAVVEINHPDEKIRYGDFNVHPTDHDLIVAIQEDHRESEVINNLAILNAATKEVKVIVEGADFYSHPKFSPNGKQVSWVQWNHPDMPWTGNELYVGEWENGGITSKTKIAGTARKVSISQPKWHLDGSLLYCSDETGFWQLYRQKASTGTSERLPIQGFENADLCGREFAIGSCTYVSLTENELLITYLRDATDGIIHYDLVTKKATKIPISAVEINGTAVQKLTPTSFVVLGSTLTAPKSLYLIDISDLSSPKETLLKSSINIPLPKSIFSLAQNITFPRTRGKNPGTLSHAIFLPPHNPSYSAPKGSKPPMIAWSHGGPTGHIGPGLVLKAQYFTSRGFAYCSINYGGSTGYGRAYREELDYNWGLMDCEDIISCIDYLSSQNLIDASKVGITGQSSGGYTTLQALCTFPTSFAAGFSLYGIGNLKALADDDPHKFESHYLFQLIFHEDSTKEEQEKVYRDRSPCFNAEKIERPLVLVQGDLDKVVPLNQAVEMERILREGGKDVELVVFEGEGHGFVMREHIKKAIELEEALWERTLVG